MPAKQKPPVVLCLSGHDPSGGAGIQADIEAIAAQGCHAATVITCLTLQDTHNVLELVPVNANLFTRQIHLICNDFTIAAVKIGLLGSSAIAQEVGRFLLEFKPAVVVLDPVLAAGGGAPLARQQMAQDILRLLPGISLLTPNRQEARSLTGLQDTAQAAAQLLSLGCSAVMVTGADEATEQQVVNSLYLDEENRCWHYPKLAGQYHGSGCTLAATTAARLALGEPLQQALTSAQDYTRQTLLTATSPGSGQSIPNRIPPCTH